jgi:nucleotide-binding universal stress UspA family protein
MDVTKERVDMHVAAFERACAEAKFTHQVIRETGDPLQELAALWRYHDVTIIGLRGFFEYGVVQNPDDQIIRLIAKGVRSIVAVAQEHRPVHRALIAYNGSIESAKAMKRFVQLRLWKKPAVEIVTLGLPDDESAPLLEDAAGYCEAHGFNTTTTALPDDPRQGLLPYAHGAEADVIVLGSTSRSRLSKLVFGDTALHTIRNSPVPLFLSQ